MQKTSKSANFAIRRFGLSLLPFSDLPFFIVTLESIVAKRKRSAARGLRDEEDPLAGVPSLFQGLYLLSCQT